MEKKHIVLAATSVALSLTVATAVAQDSLVDHANGAGLVQIQGAEQLGGEVVGIPVDIDIRDLPAYPAWQPGDPIVEVPRRDDGTAIVPKEEADRLDPLVEHQRGYDGPSPGFTEVFSFDAVSSGANPNDPTGDIGANFFIQSVNGCAGSCVGIFDKTTGMQVGSTFSMEDLAPSGICTNGIGDPIILYDQIADRWLLTEFSGSGTNGLCLYTSRTNDPTTGGWCHYAFQDSSFPDYPKFGVWPDQYIAGSNQGNVPPVYAFDRVNMLSQDGTTCPTARAPQKITGAPGLPGLGFELMIPVDLDGDTLPPADHPGIFLRHRDEELHGDSNPSPTTDPIEMWLLDTDFDNPGNTTFTQEPNIIVSDFDSNLCPPVSVFSCVPQPAGPALDPLLEVIMNRLTYRNFGSYESLLMVVQTDINDFPDHSGERWIELRRTPGRGSGWSLFQEGTWSPDAEGRFMGTIAQDQSGNILMAYNVSSTSVFPSIRYTGRLDSDPLGVMTIDPEQELATGGGNNSSARYGDYNQMGVDPVDECTFWFLGMYNPSGKAVRVGAVRFDDCGFSEEIFEDGFEDLMPNR